jgi:hypothetical protein
MVKTIDLIRFAAQHGMILNVAIAKQALQMVDREELEEQERKRWNVLVWDGNGNPPVGTRERWLHEEDAIGKAAKEAAEHPDHCVYFVMRDGKLHYFQPFCAHERGHHKIVFSDPNHEHHWEKASAKHLDMEIEQEVDRQVLEAALEKALLLHEEQGIPVGIAASSGEMK